MRPTASEIPRVDLCPASHALPQVHSTGNQYTERGMVGHRFLERYNNGESPADIIDSIDDPSLRLLVASIDLDKLPKGCAAEVAFAYDPHAPNGFGFGVARELGRGIGRDYEGHGLQSHEFAGTADLVGLLPADADRPLTVFVGDYKFGEMVVRVSESKQLRALAVYAARTYGAARAIVEIIRVRADGSVWRDRAELDALDLDLTVFSLGMMMGAVDLEEEKIAAGRQPSVVEGPHCQYCPAWDHCPAKTSAIVRLATGKELDPLASLLPLTPEMAGHAWRKVRAAERLVSRLKAECESALTRYGSLPLPEGGYLQRVITEGDEELDGRVVYQTVEKELGREWADRAVEIVATKAALDRALASAQEAGTIPPRQRKRFRDRILSMVRDLGGSTRPQTTKVMEVHPGMSSDAPSTRR